MLPPPGSVCLWKFKYWVKFIVSLSFILSIVLHFIMCGDILNGACHSIAAAARGWSHLARHHFGSPDELYQSNSIPGLMLEGSQISEVWDDITFSFSAFL